MARLTHPNIVHAYDAEQAGSRHFLVMEYVEGIDLARLLQENGPLPVHEACSSIRQAALGWRMPRNTSDSSRLKPQNLMRTADGTIRSWTSGWPALFSGRRTKAKAARSAE